MSEVELRDAILRHSLQLLRLSAHDEAEVEAIIRELEKELALLLRSHNLSAGSKAEIRALLADARKVIDPAYAKAATVVDTHGLAVIVAEKTVDAMSAHLSVAALTPTPERLASLMRDVLIEGSPLSQWWEAQRENLKDKFAAQVRLGVLAGETNERIVRRIVGGKNEPGIMKVARRHARTLVHSSVQAAANEARLATFRKNSRFIAGVRWTATLDSHTCLRCGALDGKSWDMDGSPRSDTDVAFTVPGLHANCRCVLTAVAKGFEGKREGATRASSEGQVDASTTFEAFLKRQPASFVEKTLGKTRADAFRAGKLGLRDLISGSGRELTLDELAGAI